MRAKFLIIIASIVIFSIVLTIGLIICTKPLRNYHRPTTKTVARKSVEPITQKDEDMLQKMIQSGLVEKINPNFNEAFVDPSIWAGLKYQDKENLGRFLAEYCGKKKGTGLNWVDIKDSYSGKKLAKYSESWGFKIY